MSEKRRCKNCGAFLENDEKVCYVCGEVQLPDVVSAPERSSEPRESTMVFEKDADYVMPASSTEVGRVPFDERVDYGDEDIAEPYYEMDERREKAQRKRSRKAVIIAVVCVLVVGVIGAVCFCLFNGVFSGNNKKVDNRITIYFDKPKSDVELIKSDGTVFTWTGDVEVSYDVNNKTKTKLCTPCTDHESLWKVTLPTKAKSIYFFEKDEKGLRTQVTPGFDEDMVYYVAQETFNSQNQLPLGQCERESFEGIGINYATTAQTTAAEETTAETEEETAQETTEQETEEDDTRKTEDKGYYTISLPKSWQSGVTAVENGNCTTYYEDYNYNSYSMGKLASIYVFDANDSAADNLTGVKDIRYNSDQTKKIVITTPTDIQFNEADEEAQKSYLEKNKDLNSFLDSISVQ
ncbi:MAG: hypothetical protein IJ725_00660 [Ruminococcus sp.]|nr:hypothetical protein [Ruminococcus sp.]